MQVRALTGASRWRHGQGVDIDACEHAGGARELLRPLLVLPAAVCSMLDRWRPRRPAQEALISGTQTGTTGTAQSHKQFSTAGVCSRL
jgi:hypothetical protein